MKSAVIFFWLLLAGLTIEAQPAKRLSDIIADNDIPGIQLAYSGNGKTTCYSLGTAPDGKAIVRNSTVYRAGSLGKTVFAYAVLRLQDKGLINIDTPLLHYTGGSYSKFDTKDARYSKITARMVLSHTSGLEFYGDPMMNLVAEPGKVFSYSSGGYFFLQQVLEKLTGKPLEDLMQTEVFKPLGMAHSTYAGDGDEANASFSFKTTAADYSKFLQALLNDTGLKPQTARLMFSTQSDARWLGHDTSKANDHIDWGLGVGLQRNERGKAIWHWGSVMVNFNSFYIARPDTKESLVFFTSSVSGLRAVPEIVNLFMGEQTTWAIKWLKLGYENSKAMELLHQRLASQRIYKGNSIFKGMRTAGYKFSRADLAFYGEALLKQGKLNQSLMIFKQNQQLYPHDATTYRDVAGVYLKLNNKKLALDNYRHALLLDTGNTNVTYHIKALEHNTTLTPAQLTAFAGKYKLNVMDGIFMDVKIAGKGLTIDVPGGVTNPLFYPVSATEFLNDETGFTLKFNVDGIALARSILIHTKDTVDIWERVND